MRVRLRVLHPLALLVQRRRIKRCEKYGGTMKTGKCEYPYDHYPRWSFRWELS